MFRCRSRSTTITASKERAQKSDTRDIARRKTDLGRGITKKEAFLRLRNIVIVSGLSYYRSYTIDIHNDGGAEIFAER